MSSTLTAGPSGGKISRQWSFHRMCLQSVFLEIFNITKNMFENYFVNPVGDFCFCNKKIRSLNIVNSKLGTYYTIQSNYFEITI
jgi:hypothetical protein